MKANGYKKVWGIMLVVLIALAMVSCATEKLSDVRATEATAKAMSEAFREIGMPNIVNFQQKKLLKMVYELCDKEDLICHAYLFNSFSGKVGQYLGKCLGFGIPFSAQYTNPEKVVQGDHALGYDLAGYVNHPMTIPQEDPNGLFMPTVSSATWLIMIDPKTKKPRPVYVEPEIIVSPFPLHKE